MDCKQVGTVEILRIRTYPIDGETSDPQVQGIVPPGVYPLYELGKARFWVLEGVLSLGGAQKIGDGMFTMVAGDVESDIAVRFPSRMFGPREWKELLALPSCQEGHLEQRLRIQLQGGAD